MTLKEAKRVRDEVKNRGLWCIVPLGHGPDNYFARISTCDFQNETEARSYLANMFRKRRRQQREWDALRRPRSPIEMMVDRACGLT